MKNYKISLILNSIIVLFVMLGTTLMFLGIKFMPTDLTLEEKSIEMFKYFTVDSNIFMGLTSLLFIIYDYKIIKNNTKEIPKKIYILKYISTCAITLTFVITAFFLTPQYGFKSMYSNNNLFFHLVVPVLSLIAYIFFEKYDNKYKYAFLGIIPTIIYSIYYGSRILIHLNDGGLTYKYDFYGFLQGDINNTYKTIPTMYIFSLLLSVLLVFLNKKINKLKTS